MLLLELMEAKRRLAFPRPKSDFHHGLHQEKAVSSKTSDDSTIIGATHHTNPRQER